MFIFIVASLVAMTIFVGYFIFKSRKRKNPSFVQEGYDIKAITIQQIDRMEDGSEFELYLYRLFLALGYEAYKTVGSRDFGADLVFTDSEGVRTVVQAKRYSDPVGIHAVQEIYSSMRFYKAKKSIVITNSSFTGSCEKLAGYNHVSLLSRIELQNIISAFKDGRFSNARDIIESEPRILLDAWNDYLKVDTEIKKDRKAELYVNSMMK